MNIYKGIITLDYEPATDVLVTSMPDVRQYGLSEVSVSLGIIVSNIRNYDIKKLLLDASQSVVAVESESYSAVVKKFTLDLMSTRLQKLARVSTTDVLREAPTARIASEVRQELRPTIEHRNFTSPIEALAWLLEKQPL